MSARKIVIFGDGAIAELAHYYFTEDSDYDVVAFSVDADRQTADSFHDLPVAPFENVADRYPSDNFDFFIAIGYGRLNQLRQQKYVAAKAMGYRCASYVASRAAVARNVPIGDNCFILENQTIQPFCTIGNNVTLWSGNHIGHHSIIGDHSFFASHIVVSGSCQFGERCFVGVNATFRDGCIVGDDSFVGMAATVSAEVPAGSVVLGSPSEILLPDDRRARAIKRSYFKI